MSVDVLVLNTAVADFRRPEFEFTDELVGKGGLAKCDTKDMPCYSQKQYRRWIEQKCVTAGGPGNTAPLISRTGLNVAVGANLGKGEFEELDAQGKYFLDVMRQNRIDTSYCLVHPYLPTGTTYIHDAGGNERGGIAYFPNANNDFDFEKFKPAVEKFSPSIVYYMYSGLSDRGDANGGRNLAEFVKWCSQRGAVTIVDSHTLTGNPEKLIDTGASVEEYKLLEPVLGVLDVFFTSADEARMIENTLNSPRDYSAFGEDENNRHFLDFLTGRFWSDCNQSRFFGVTVSDGAYEKHCDGRGQNAGPTRVKSPFMAGEVVDLVGAGDSFRAGLISYIARNMEQFREGKLNCAEAVQMGNLFAALYIKAPLDDRYGNITSYEKMAKVIKSGRQYPTFEALKKALS